jgi:CheY-like chemotaxis protein
MKKRKKRRVLFEKDVIINGIITAYALDISEDGMYIHTTANFVRDAMLDLDFDVDNKHIKVKATIQHIQPGIGLGVKFINMPPEDRLVLKEFISRSSDVGEIRVSQNVLLVDGNAQSRSIYKNRLLQDGFTVTEAADGQEAFRALQHSKFDLVILDLRIEKIDGFKILQLMRVNPDLKRIPVMVLSSGVVPEDVEKAVALGARDYLVKTTTTPIKLSEKVKEILQEKR